MSFHPFLTFTSRCSRLPANAITLNITTERQSRAAAERTLVIAAVFIYFLVSIMTNLGDGSCPGVSTAIICHLSYLPASLFAELKRSLRVPLRGRSRPRTSVAVRAARILGALGGADQSNKMTTIEAFLPLRRRSFLVRANCRH